MYGTANILMSVVFAVLSVGASYLLLRKSRPPFLLAYAAGQMAFFYGLLKQDYSVGVSIGVLLWAHLFAYLFFLLVLVTGRTRCRRTALAGVLPSRRITDSIVLGVCVSWMAFKLYLVGRYGMLGFALSKSISADVDAAPFMFWETVVSSFLGLLVLGGIVSVAIKHSLGGKVSRTLLIVLLCTALVYLSSNESPVGARRLLFTIAALWVFGNWARYGGAFGSLIRKRLLPMALAAALVGVVMLYYQAIRYNVWDEQIVADLLSGEPAAMLRGAGRFAIPRFDGGADDAPGFIRAGPFDFFAKVVDVVSDGRTSAGTATQLSVALVVPRVLYPGNKPVGDVDEVLLEYLKIIPAQPYLLIDYSTSVPAIGYSDAGVAGLLVAALVVGGLFRLYSAALIRVRHWRLLYLVVLSALTQLAASQEAGLTAVLATLRDVLLFSVVYLIVLTAVRAFTRVVRLAVRSSSALDAEGP